MRWLDGKKLYLTIALIWCCLLGLETSIRKDVVAKRQERDERRSNELYRVQQETRDDEREKRINATQDIINVKLDRISSKIDPFITEATQALKAGATNSPPNPDAILALAQAVGKLEKMATELGDLDSSVVALDAELALKKAKREQGQLEEMEMRQQKYKESLSVYDYMVAKLATNLATVAKKYGQPAPSELPLFPRDLPSDSLVSFSVGLTTNSVWSFNIRTMQESVMIPPRVHISYQTDGDTFAEIRWATGSWRGELAISGEPGIIYVERPDYRQAIDQTLDKLVAAQARRLSK